MDEIRQGDDAILCGDFNERRDGAGMRALRRTCHCITPTRGVQPTYRGWKRDRGAEIDFVLTSGYPGVVAAVILVVVLVVKVVLAVKVVVAVVVVVVLIEWCIH